MRSTGTVSPDVQPGLIVYRPYSPQNAGVVMQNLGREGHVARLMVRWLDGSETPELSASVRDLDALIADHASKLSYHRKIRKRAAELVPPLA